MPKTKTRRRKAFSTAMRAATALAAPPANLRTITDADAIAIATMILRALNKAIRLQMALTRAAAREGTPVPRLPGEVKRKATKRARKP